jgi:manganese/zinc/iron transport system permease protein
MRRCPAWRLLSCLAGRELGFLLIGAGIASWLGVHFIGMVTDTTRIKQDTAMGIVLAAWFAAGIALLAYIQARPDASQAGWMLHFWPGGGNCGADVQLIAGVGLV